jgi:hypothetical protein
MVNDEPLTGMVPIGTGWTGFCPCAEAAVTCSSLAVPENPKPLVAVACELVGRLIATNTNPSGLLLPALA